MQKNKKEDKIKEWAADANSSQLLPPLGTNLKSYNDSFCWTLCLVYSGTFVNIGSLVGI